MTREFVDPEDELDLNRILKLKAESQEYGRSTNQDIVWSKKVDQTKLKDQPIPEIHEPSVESLRHETFNEFTEISNSESLTGSSMENQEIEYQKISANPDENVPDVVEISSETSTHTIEKKKQAQIASGQDLLKELSLTAAPVADNLSNAKPTVNAFEMMLRKRKPDIITIDDERKHKRPDSKGKEPEIMELRSRSKGKQPEIIELDSISKGKQTEVVDLDYAPPNSQTKVNPFFMSKKERKEQLMIENQIKLQLSIKKNQQISAEISVGKSTNPFFQPKKYLTSTVGYQMENIMPGKNTTHVGYTKSHDPVLRNWLWKPKRKSAVIPSGEFDCKINKEKSRIPPISIYALEELLVFIGDLVPECELDSSWLQPYYSSLIEGEMISPQGLWVDYFKPTKIKQVIGHQNQQACKEIRDWIKYWKPKKHIDDFDEGEMLVIHGPVGSGKTTLAQMVCKQMGIDVIELDTSMLRTQKLFDSVVGNSVVLVDDVDVVMYKDKGFWQGIDTLKTKNRVILTTLTLHGDTMDNLNAKVVELNTEGVINWVRVVCASIGYWVEGNLVGDKRSLLNQIQFGSKGIPREFGGVALKPVEPEILHGRLELEQDEMIPLFPKLHIPEPLAYLVEEEEDVVPRKHRKPFKENYLWDVPYMSLMCGKIVGRRRKNYLYWLDLDEIEQLQHMYS
ncbi:replication factor C subunit 1 [Terramyces sp. JEL0728]|nr:replication factor C subunit 1 [Terramyces sp. JEL0728]